MIKKNKKIEVNFYHQRIVIPTKTSFFRFAFLIKKVATLGTIATFYHILD